MADFELMFENRTDDVDVDLTVEGELPPSLKGTLYAIGGAGTRVGDTPLNLLDAHGRVTAVKLGDGAPRLRARMVETPLWLAERGARAIAKRRLFVNKPSRWSNLFDIDLANPAGHNVVPWGSDLVAANDPGFFRLDPETLATRGPVPLAPKKGATLCPMPRRDPETGRYVRFEARPGRKDTLVVREVEDDFSVASERTYVLGRGGAFFHDVGFTERYYLVMQWAAASLPTFLWGKKPVIEALRFDPEATPLLHLLPRAGGDPISVPLPGGRVHFHLWNAFQAGESVVADVIGYGGRVDFSGLTPPAARADAGTRMNPLPRPATYRYTVDPARRAARGDTLSDLAVEAPEIRADRRGRTYRYGWAPTAGAAGDEEDRYAFIWFHALARLDFESGTSEVWDAGPRAYVSAVAFVPREGGAAEDDGHVLAFIQDAATEKTTVGVFDAARVGAGPVARLSGAGLVGGISHVAFA